MALVLVTGATGYIGGQLVPELLRRGHTVRVLTRHPSGLPSSSWAHGVEVVEGDASRATDCRRALDEVDTAFYLLHSMDAEGNFRQRDESMAQTFADAAAGASVARIVYLSGLHPDGELSDHLASRVEVGKIFLNSPTPAVVLQAGVVLGNGSASFDMLRQLTERLPAMIAPRWVDNRIQPIAVRDAVHYLAGAVNLPAATNRTFDIGGPEVLTYQQMMQRYAAAVGLRHRRIISVPVLTPRLAGLWVGIVTPISAGIARPLVGSLVHDAVCREDDVLDAIEPPPHGRTGFDEAVRSAVADLDPHRWIRTLARNSVIVGSAAAVGSVLTAPNSRWYQGLAKPAWQPPPAAFPIVWTALYATTTVATALAGTELAEGERAAESHALERALIVNMVLNAGWTGLFFRARRPWLATVECALLTASSADLARRAGAAGRGKATGVGLYAGWCLFATALSGSIARRNRGSH